MRGKCLWMFAVVWLSSIHSYEFHGEHAIAKRMDLESCLGQFDVHRNMIIRTEESLAIGGKYLQGIALETVEECRRLCCETDSCDVFVFEEKSEGYCYLFECGPPENFRCKFTKHGNFTSAVLTPIRHITPPPPPPPAAPKTVQLPSSSSATGHSHQSLLHSTSTVISQQERELTNLKQKLDSRPSSSVLSTSMSLTPPPPPPPPNHTTPKAPSAVTISNCGRFQFQCHSGECIGIYNACNGIPQCEDGSDEGPECTGNQGTITKIDHPLDDTTLSKQNVIQTMTRQYQSPQILQVQPIINNREDPMSAPQLWPNRKLIDIQDQNSHIFNHKGGIQLPSSGSVANLQQQFGNSPNLIYNQIPNQRLTNSIYLQPSNDLQNQYRQAILQPQDNLILSPNVNWVAASPQQQQQQPQNILAVGGNSYNGQQLQPQSPSAIKITQEMIDVLPPSPPIPNSNLQNSVKLTEGPTANNNPGDKLNTKKKDSPNSKESEEYIDYVETSTERPTKKKGHKHKSTNTINKKDDKDPVETALNTLYHGQYRLMKDNLDLEFTDHDGYSERPGGAVLSLTLGVLVAAALAILIGCRMRTVGRRVRRMGKTQMGNDADFLVNGMYL